MTKKPNLLISTIRQYLDAAEHHLRDQNFKMTLAAFDEMIKVTAQTRSIVKEIIFKENEKNMIHNPTLDRVADWIKRFKKKSSGACDKQVADIILEQIEMMKEE